MEDGNSRSSFLVDHDAEIDASAFRVQELDAIHLKLEFLDLLVHQGKHIQRYALLELKALRLARQEPLHGVTLLKVHKNRS